MPPFMIGIAGPSGSGKTSIARALAARLGKTTVFGLDAYYHDLSHLAPDQRVRFNFDHPQSLESEMLIQHLAALSKGKPVRRPVYDFASHTRTKEIEIIEPGDYLIVEGLFTFFWPAVCDLFQVKAFVEAPDSICLARRSSRDMRERGRTRESVLKQWDETVRPMGFQFVLPTRRVAELILDGEQPIAHSVNLIFDLILSKIALTKVIKSARCS